MKTEDSMLWAGLRARQEFAYTCLFRQYYRPLYSFAANYIRDEDAARDIVQALFVEIYEKAPSLRVSSSLSSYLFSATHNRCLNFLRARRIMDSHLANIIEAHIFSNTLEEFEDGSFIGQLEGIVEAMPPRTQEIFRLRIVGELLFREIAEQLGITENNAKVQMSGAVKFIREKMSKM